MAQEQEARRSGKKKGEPKLEFQAGKVFELGSLATPADAKDNDLEARASEAAIRDMNRDAATYRARKGEGGDRSRVYGLV